MTSDADVDGTVVGHTGERAADLPDARMCAQHDGSPDGALVHRRTRRAGDRVVRERDTVTLDVAGPEVPPPAGPLATSLAAAFGTQVQLVVSYVPRTRERAASAR